MNKRLHALCDLAVSSMREYVGLHDDYDGRVQDLSVEGVRAGLARLGGPPLGDPLDDAYVAAHERAMRVELGELELHRRNPLYHVGGLDLSCYDRDRKSTRLNSSHPSISYAVFCLKKKNL